MKYLALQIFLSRLTMLYSVLYLVLDMDFHSVNVFVYMRDEGVHWPITWTNLNSSAVPCRRLVLWHLTDVLAALIISGLSPWRISYWACLSLDTKQLRKGIHNLLVIMFLALLPYEHQGEERGADKTLTLRPQNRHMRAYWKTVLSTKLIMTEADWDAAH